MTSLAGLLADVRNIPYYWIWLAIWLPISLTIIALAIAFRRRLLSRIESAPPSVAALTILALIITGLSLLSSPTGDEPHYLIMTQSLLRDGDFDLRNNYEQMDYLEYYPEPIPDPHVTIVGDHWYPVHDFGLPILAAPWFAVGGRAGVVVMLALMTVAGIRMLWSLLRRAGFDLRSTGIAAVTAGLTLPLASLAGQVFPEVPAFLLVVLALRSILAPSMTKWDLAGICVSLAVLPWLHAKYVALAVALLLSAAILHRERATLGKLAIAGVVLTGSVAGLALVSYWFYGAPLPGVPILMWEASFGNDWLMPIVGLFLAHPEVGLAGILFDQQAGLFFASPLYVLAIPGMLLLWRRRPAMAIASAIVFFSVYLMAGAWAYWYGGFSSPARFLVPTVPVLALGMAGLLQWAGRPGWFFFTVLAVPSFLHAYLITTLPSFTRYGDPTTHHNFFIALLERFTHLDLTLLFPSFLNVSQATWVTLVAYLLALALITVVLLRTDVAHRTAKPS